MTKPEKEFADLMAAEAEKRGLNFFLVIINGETEQFSYRSRVATDTPAVASFFTWVNKLFAEASRIGKESPQ